MSDTLDDLCPICGEPIRDGEPWTIVDGQMVHEHCEPDALNGKIMGALGGRDQ